MATNPILGRDVYLALAAVGWADGQLTAAAADAIVRTALEEGLELDEIAEIDAATKSPIDLGVVDRMNMSKADRLYVYAVASWIAQIDGDTSDKKLGALAKLGSELGVPEAPRAHADAILREIAAQGDRPARFDLRTLRRTLDDEIEAASVARRLSKVPTDRNESMRDLLEHAESALAEHTASPTSETPAPTVMERPRPDIRYLVMFTPGSSWQPGVDFRDQDGFGDHVRHWAKAQDDGKIEIGGGFLDGSGAMMIPMAGQLEGEIDAWAAEDPAVVSGLFSYSIKKWYISMKRPNNGH